MVQDSSGFQSQQFGEQVAQRRDRYAAQNIDTWGQAANVVPRFQQAQQAVDERQMRAAKVASDLASDQLHRQQALEDLQWAQQLHQADMIGLQKKNMALDIQLKEAQVKKTIEELGGGERIPYTMLTPERMDYAISKLGIMADPASGMRVRAATKEERAAAEQREKERLQREQQDMLEQIRTRNEGRGTSDALETQRDVGITGKRLEQLLEIIADKESKARNKRTDPTEKAMIEQELIGLRRTAKQLGDKMDQALLGDERPAASQQPEQTVDGFLSRQSADALKILYPDGK